MNIKKMVLTSFFAALTFIGVIIKIPTPLAPYTLQLLFVLMAGFILGPKYGAISQIIYTAIGLIGIPVFSYGGGLSYVMHPTFGFLIGFIATSFVAGYFYKKNLFKNKFLDAIFAGSLGTLACYIIGLPYLYLIFNLHLDLNKSIYDVIYGGMLIFLPGDLIKLLLSSYLSIEILNRAKFLKDS